MKKIFMTFISLVLFIGTNTAVFADTATESVIIHYSGTVTIPPCTISTKNISVNLGDVQAETLADSNSATDWKDMAILLTDCTDVTTAMMAVSNTPSAENPKYIASTGTAKHVAIEAEAFLLSDIPFYNGSVFTFNIDGRNSYSFGAHVRLHNDGTGAATTGTVVSTITLTFEFK